ncbi:MAG TPA: hypothetical protein VFS11_07220 [Gemmatimonadales bacterium]|nr:hypothetical protein [Gemmatimonadales bacterium]
MLSRSPSYLARVRGAGLALALAACSATPKTPVPTVALPPAADTLRAPFRDAAGAVWLGGQRWAVVSEGSGVVGIVDFAAHTVSPLGGRQSKELRNPFAVFAVADTLGVSDWGLRRVSLWTLDGKLARTVAATAATRGALPRARDAAGRFYVAVMPRPGPDGSGNRDSAAIVRTTPDLARADTVARLAPLDITEVQGEAGRRFERRVFSGTDQWGVLPDGSIWIARVYQNRVEWIDSSGKVTRGESLPDRVLEVTRADRELFVRTFPPELRSTAEQLPYAAVKPPFESAFTGADGVVWLHKSRSVADSAGRYQVVDRAGRLRREIRVPGYARILAAGPSSAFAVEADSAGLLLLQFAVPAEAPLVSRGDDR